MGMLNRRIHTSSLNLSNHVSYIFHVDVDLYVDGNVLYVRLGSICFLGVLDRFVYYMCVMFILDDVYV